MKLEQAARQLLIDIAVGNQTDASRTALREALDHFADAGKMVPDHIATSGKMITLTADRELLELAAKAAGIEYKEHTIFGLYTPKRAAMYWNPLTDDGDALRLAVKLGICIAPGCNTLTHGSKYAVATGDNGEVLEERRADPYAATRRAIVRAAAEIGKELP